MLYEVITSRGGGQVVTRSSRPSSAPRSTDGGSPPAGRRRSPRHLADEERLEVAEARQPGEAPAPTHRREKGQVEAVERRVFVAAEIGPSYNFV